MHSSDLIGDRTESGEVYRTCVRCVPAYYQLGAQLLRLPLYRVVVEHLSRFVQAVMHKVVEPAREVDRRAVRQMPTVVKRQTHHSVPRLEQREIRRHVGLGSAVRLDIHMLCPGEYALRPTDRERLRNVYVLRARVVTPTRIAFGILIGQDRPGGFQYGPRSVVLRRDQNHIFAQSPLLGINYRRDFWICIAQHFRVPSARSSTAGGACQVDSSLIA